MKAKDTCLFDELAEDKNEHRDRHTPDERESQWREWIDSYYEGNEDALSPLFLAAQSVALNEVQRRGVRVFDEDVASSVASDFIDHIINRTYDSKRSPVSYLLSIANNQAVDRLRYEGRRRKVSLFNPKDRSDGLENAAKGREPPVETDQQDSLDMNRFREVALRSIRGNSMGAVQDEQNAQIIGLHLRGTSNKGIAEQFNVDENVVSSRVSSYRGRLVRNLRREGGTKIDDTISLQELPTQGLFPYLDLARVNGAEPTKDQKQEISRRRMQVLESLPPRQRMLWEVRGDSTTLDHRARQLGMVNGDKEKTLDLARRNLDRGFNKSPYEPPHEIWNEEQALEFCKRRSAWEQKALWHLWFLDMPLEKVAEEVGMKPDVLAERLGKIAYEERILDALQIRVMLTEYHEKWGKQHYGWSFNRLKQALMPLPAISRSAVELVLLGGLTEAEAARWPGFRNTDHVSKSLQIALEALKQQGHGDLNPMLLRRLGLRFGLTLIGDNGREFSESEFRAAISPLEGDLKTVMELFYLERWDRDEVAHHMQRPVDWVNGQLEEALKIVNKRMGGEIGDNPDNLIVRPDPYFQNIGLRSKTESYSPTAIPPSILPVVVSTNAKDVTNARSLRQQDESVIDEAVARMGHGGSTKANGDTRTSWEMKLREGEFENTLQAFSDRDRNILRRYFHAPRESTESIAEAEGTTVAAVRIVIGNWMKAFKRARILDNTNITAPRIKVIPDALVPWRPISTEGELFQNRPVEAKFTDQIWELPTEWRTPEFKGIKVHIGVAQFEKAIEGLDSRKQDILKRFYLDGESLPEIGGVYTMGKAGIRLVIAKALPHMASQIGVSWSGVTPTEIRVIKAETVQRRKRLQQRVSGRDLNHLGTTKLPITQSEITIGIERSKVEEERKELLRRVLLKGESIEDLAREQKSDLNDLRQRISRAFIHVSDALGINGVRMHQVKVVSDEAVTEPTVKPNPYTPRYRLSKGIIYEPEFDWALANIKSPKLKGDKHRMALRMYYLKGFSRQDICTALEIVPVTLDSYLSDGVSLIQQTFNQKGWHRDGFVVVPLPEFYRLENESSN